MKRDLPKAPLRYDNSFKRFPIKRTVAMFVFVCSAGLAAGIVTMMELRGLFQ